MRRKAQEKLNKKQAEATEVVPKARAPLPDGWEEHYDHDQANYYFFNTITQQSTWERPVLPAHNDAPAMSDAETTVTALSLGMSARCGTPSGNVRDLMLLKTPPMCIAPHEPVLEEMPFENRETGRAEKVKRGRAHLAHQR